MNVVGRVWRALQGQAMILTYHRVTELARDPQLLAVAPSRFSAHLELLRREWHPIGLRALARALAAGRVPRRAVCVTLDDGYRDNLINAKPLLDRADIPATVFIASGALDDDAVALSDEIEALLLGASEPPEHVRVTVGTVDQEWTLGTYTAAQEARDSGWNVLDPHDPSPRHSAYRALHAQLHRLGAAARRSALAASREALGIPAKPSGRRMLTEQEVAALAASGSIEIGAHSVNHPKLRFLSEAEQDREISESKRRLESIVGAEVTSFAYPYGTREDYDEHTIALVRKAGFKLACSNFEGLTTPRTPLHELPRFVVRDWDGDAFAKHLRGWVG
jgi:peptidoglycan/xylan/chitin deacetylase (PgdA/CDA1 family)